MYCSLSKLDEVIIFLIQVRPCCRVKKWRLRGFNNLLVSISCHLKPWMRFSRTRLSYDPSHPGAFKATTHRYLSSNRVMLSRSSTVQWPPPTPHPAFLQTSFHQLIPAVTADVDCRPGESTPDSIVYCHNIPFPIRRKVLRATLQV